jgi:hypothetical protein
VAGYCEHGNEPSGSVKGGEFLNWLSDCQLLKKEPVLWNEVVLDLTSERLTTRVL